MIPSFLLNQNAGGFDTEQASIVALPPGFAGKVFVPERAQPRIIQAVAVNDIGALEDYLTRMVPKNGEELAIYCDTNTYTFRCVLDHTNGESPGNNQHVATLKLVLSEEFKPLHDAISKPMEQMAFMAFIEEHAHLFREAAALLQMVETFESVQIARFKSVKNQQNSMSTLVYDTAEDADRTTKVPHDVTMSVPIFMGQPDTELAVKLRYDPRGGKVQFRLECFGLRRIILKAVEAIELRLREYCERRELSAALIVRGTATLAVPEPAQVIELETKPLPVGLGGGITSYTHNQVTEKPRY